MNNSEYIRENLTDEMIADFIYKKYCKNGNCRNCPMRGDCENIFELMNKNGNSEPIDRILYWLKNSHDNVFFADRPSMRQKKLDSYHWRACGMCKRLSTEIPVAGIYINSYGSPKTITYICEDCYKKFCKIMNIPEHKHLDPSFNLTSVMPRKRKKPKQDYTVCWNCGTRCSPKHFYCHECGTLLDK